MQGKHIELNGTPIEGWKFFSNMVWPDFLNTILFAIAPYWLSSNKIFISYKYNNNNYLTNYLILKNKGEAQGKTIYFELNLQS